MDTPVFDESKDHSTIFGSGQVTEGPQRRYQQNGHYFTASKSYLESDPGASVPLRAVPKVIPQSTPEPNKDTITAVDPGEVDEILKDPRAADLLAKPRDTIAALVQAANGPLIAGPGSHQAMVAFLLKNTVPDDEL